MQEKLEWFGQWFDSPFYHTLYQHRDDTEAKAFMDELVQYFSFRPIHHILDLACGKGRHSVYLNSLGLNVTGVDLSKSNIDHAMKFENERLHFHIHDMRESFGAKKYDFILNLFTSFGYFNTKQENMQAIINIGKALQPEGRVLIDFLNPYVVRHNLVPCEEKQIGEVKFTIDRHIDVQNFIIKNIRIEAHEQHYSFQEKVKAIDLEEFETYFRAAEMQIEQVFGDYRLAPYQAEKSNRMIIVGKLN